MGRWAPFHDAPTWGITGRALGPILGMEKFTVKIIVCAKSPSFFDREDVGVWNIQEVGVTEDQYDNKREAEIVAPYYTDGVIFVGIYSWME